MVTFSAKLADDPCLSLSSAGVMDVCSRVLAFYVGAGILTHVTTEPTPQAQMSQGDGERERKAGLAVTVRLLRGLCQHQKPLELRLGI